MIRLKITCILLFFMLSSCAFSHSGKYGTVTVTLTVTDIENLHRLVNARSGDDYRSEDGKTIIRIGEKNNVY